MVYRWCYCGGKVPGRDAGGLSWFPFHPIAGNEEGEEKGEGEGQMLSLMVIVNSGAGCGGGGCASRGIGIGNELAEILRGVPGDVQYLFSSSG